MIDWLRNIQYDEWRALLDVVLIASVVTVACALPGTFLVLRKMALMSDAISHSVLFGIVIAFVVMTQIGMGDALGSPLLIIGAAAAGLLTVALTELIITTRRLKEDAAIGLVFPFLFSIAVIIISRQFKNVHIDADAVLLGSLEYSALDSMQFFGLTLRPKALYIMSGILALNVILIALFYKELKIVSFDAGLAATLGFSPALVHYGLMTMVSVTCVGAFDAVGSILVVALMIAPPATAYLLTDRLSRMLLLSAAAGLLAAWTGIPLAFFFDFSYAGSIATMSGVIFLHALMMAPDRGLLAQWAVRRAQRFEFPAQMLAVHLFHHEGRPDQEAESSLRHLREHFKFGEDRVRQVVSHALRKGYIQREHDRLRLTNLGRETARSVMIRT
ncbi:metal ABC transporter permease [Candidatus Sumerlaeota bacterium]|nr:metal ABC transporter permease [Candidatus Sumerlaeota bacterium]